MKILIATRNPGKLHEYEDLLADALPDGADLEWVTITDLGIDTDVEETGETFAANALLKAEAYASESGLLTLADDSGLEVDALGGAPGVRTARYAGPGASDADRYNKLLGALADVPEPERGARFRCAVAVCTPEGRSYSADGTCEGRIAFAPRGSNGFGYDPVFLLEGRDETMAELDPEVKNRISHRAHALEAIKPVLTRLLTGEDTR